ncbi:MAG: hypothetical protein H5U37_00450 [Caldisericia bacterium]|nr:hypothetical protein [Caldisericia bacterium]
MKKSLKIIILIMLILAIGLISYILINKKMGTSKIDEIITKYISSKYEITIPQSIPFLILTPNDFRNPETSLRYGYKGYVEIGLLEDSPFKDVGDKKILYIKNGDEVSIPLSLHFVSHVKEIDKVEVILDTMEEVMGERLTSVKYYGITDENGNVIKRGEVLINELISYEPNCLVLKNGETKDVIMKIKIPKDFPPVINFQVNPMGIWSSIEEIAVFQNENINKIWEVVIND